MESDSRSFSRAGSTTITNRAFGLGQRDNLQSRSTHDDVLSYLRKIRRYLTTKEVSIVLRKHPETVYRMIGDGFPAMRDGGRWKYDSCKVADWIEQRSTDRR